MNQRPGERATDHGRMAWLLSLVILGSTVSVDLRAGSAGTNKFISEYADQTVTGIIKDEKGEGLPGVSILIKGSQAGAITDASGSFSISVPNGSSVLVVSYVGFFAQEITVGNRSSIEITLKSDTKALDEVVVIGYGTSKRQDFTGSVSSLKLEGSAVAMLPSMNALETLKGSLLGWISEQPILRVASHPYKFVAKIQ